MSFSAFNDSNVMIMYIEELNFDLFEVLEPYNIIYSMTILQVFQEFSIFCIIIHAIQVLLDQCNLIFVPVEI